AVFKVEDSLTKAKLALKVIPVRSEADLVHTATEVEILEACRSPYVVSLVNSWLQLVPLHGTITTCRFLLMELCSMSLKDLIDHCPSGMDLDLIKTYTAQILNGLDHVHR
ncbi:cyclin-dependent kinase, partial [Elysia marginata]